LVEANNRAAIHFFVRTVAAMHSDHGCLVTVAAGVGVGTAERFGPIRSQPLGMLRVEAVAEGMADHLIFHHPSMPRVSKTAQAVHAAGRFKNSTHASMMTTVPPLCKIEIFPRIWDVRFSSMRLRLAPFAGHHAQGGGDCRWSAYASLEEEE
jgi:hypothetical protein